MLAASASHRLSEMEAEQTSAAAAEEYERAETLASNMAQVIICPAPNGPTLPSRNGSNGTLRAQLTRELDAHSARTSSLLVEYFKLEATPARPNACRNPAALGPPHGRSRRYAQRCPTTPPSALKRR
jgi:hypothetical protein